MEKKLLTAAALSLTMLAGSAWAMGGADVSASSASGEVSFEGLDTDGDGMISQSEWDAAMSDMDSEHSLQGSEMDTTTGGEVELEGETLDDSLLQGEEDTDTGQSETDPSM